MPVVQEYQKRELVRVLWYEGSEMTHRYFRRRLTRNKLIRLAAGCCTFRSFRGLDEPPSVIFREWAVEKLDRQFMQTLAEVKTQEEFDAIHEALRADIAECWERRGGKALRYGPGLKLINLLLKSVVRWQEFTHEQREKLIPLLHVPLDKFSLRAIRLFSNDPERVRRPVFIPRNASMGFVETRKQYRRIQGVMREIATVAAEPPISVDLLTWDLVHAY